MMTDGGKTSTSTVENCTCLNRFHKLWKLAATFPCYGHFEKEMTWKNLNPSPRMPVANEGLCGFSKLKI